MTSRHRLALPALVLCLLAPSAFGQAFGKGFAAQRSNDLQSLLDTAVSATLKDFASKGLKDDEIAVTVIDLSDPKNLRSASYRGGEKIYPASVVKMFYMAALQQFGLDGKIEVTDEVRRGLADMITVSSNDATGYILDVLTHTSSGAEMPQAEYEKWAFRRNIVNRYYASLGYTDINVNQKTFCEDAYGVEQQFRGYKGENRNMLTTDATARLLAEIVLGKAVNAERSREMMALMVRNWEKPVRNPDDREFISHALEPGTKLWSKEGWTSSTRHDAAYVETADGRKVVFAIFTENHAQEIGIIPGIAKRVLEGLKSYK
jgi:beta-lactamase class A